MGVPFGNYTLYGRGRLQAGSHFWEAARSD